MMREISSSANKSLVISMRLYRLLLAAYPAEFRHEYGAQMAQVFRDRCREEQGRRRGGNRSSAGLWRVWMETILDLARTAPEEHLQYAGRGVCLMKALLKIAAAIVVYAVLFMLIGKFLSGSREHLPFLLGTLIDSLVAIGILFNFLVLVFFTTRLLTAVRAVITSGIITSVLVIAMVAAIALSHPADGRPNGAVIMGLLVSFLLWFGVHWFWAQKKNQTQAAA
jgi:hypothetical protein